MKCSVSSRASSKMVILHFSELPFLSQRHVSDIYRTSLTPLDTSWQPPVLSKDADEIGSPDLVMFTVQLFLLFTGWNGIKCAGLCKLKGSLDDKWQFTLPAAISNIIIKCGVILHSKALASPSILSAHHSPWKWTSSCRQTNPKPGMINHPWPHKAAGICSALCLHPLANSLEEAFQTQTKESQCDR